MMRSVQTATESKNYITMNRILYNGEELLAGDPLSMRMFFNNISGKNFPDKQSHRLYLKTLQLQQMLHETGTLELQIDGKTVETKTFG